MRKWSKCMPRGPSAPATKIVSPMIATPASLTPPPGIGPSIRCETTTSNDDVTVPEASSLPTVSGAGEAGPPRPAICLRVVAERLAEGPLVPQTSDHVQARAADRADTPGSGPSWDRRLRLPAQLRTGQIEDVLHWTRGT